jgi:hypothetical protein
MLVYVGVSWCMLVRQFVHVCASISTSTTKNTGWRADPWVYTCAWVGLRARARVCVVCVCLPCCVNTTNGRSSKRQQGFQGSEISNQVVNTAALGLHRSNLLVDTSPTPSATTPTTSVRKPAASSAATASLTPRSLGAIRETGEGTSSSSVAGSRAQRWWNKAGAWRVGASNSPTVVPPDCVCCSTGGFDAKHPFVYLVFEYCSPSRLSAPINSLTLRERGGCLYG